MRAFFMLFLHASGYNDFGQTAPSKFTAAALSPSEPTSNARPSSYVQTVRIEHGKCQ
jgi:hypothetical protein